MQVCAATAFHAHFFAHCLRKHKKIWQHSSSVIQQKEEEITADVKSTYDIFLARCRFVVIVITHVALLLEVAR